MIVCYFVGKDENGILRRDLWFFLEGIVFFFFEEKNFFLKFLMDVSDF